MPVRTKSKRAKKAKKAKSLIGLKVKTYYHSHKKCFSVMHEGRVVKHVKSLNLIGVTFRVSEKGRERVIAEDKKNVHAFVCGTVVTNLSKTPRIPVSYNPYYNSEFVYCSSGKPIKSIAECSLKGSRVYV